MNPKADELSDDFVASLLSKEAKDKNIRYSALGLQAFLPKRSTTNAPKPNTRFLRNIVREADSHNAALLAKEAEESKERLRILRLKERTARRGNEVTEGEQSSNTKSRATQRPDRELYRVGRRKEAAPTTRETVRDSEVRTRDRERERKRRRSRSPTPGERSRSPDRERRRHKRRSGSGERRRSGSRSRKHREHRSERRHGEKERDGDKHKDRKRDRERGQKTDDKKEPSEKHRESRHRSPTRSKQQDDSDIDMDRNSRKKKKGVEPTFERASTDPLDEIIGPAPLPPPSRARGRGTTSGSSAMDARFSAEYDPSMDVRPDSDEDDDWDNAIEAYRDRQKWKTLGAERLRKAGFAEDFITAWENNDTKNTANIRWAKEGVREWDRGKVVEEDTGEVSVRASWAKGGVREWDRGKVVDKKTGEVSMPVGWAKGAGWDEGRLNEGRLNRGEDEGRLNGSWDLY